MKLRWSPEAADDFAEILEYIRLQNPSAAQKAAEKLFSGITSLQDFPKLGRTGREPETRELVFSQLPYIVIYREHADAVEIVRILHGAQRWPL